jgi:hypothetical protein
VLTAGTRFRAISTVLSARFPGMPIRQDLHRTPGLSERCGSLRLTLADPQRSLVAGAGERDDELPY